MATMNQPTDAINALPGMTATQDGNELRVTFSLEAMQERYPDRDRTWLHDRSEVVAVYTEDADYALAAAKRMSEWWQANGQQAQPAPGALPSLPGCTMRYNDEPGVAGVEIVTPAGEVIMFGGRPALEEFARDNHLSARELDTLSALDAQADKYRNRPQYPDYAASEPDAGSVPPGASTEAAASAGPFLFLELEDTGNAAFVDVGREEEIGRIVSEAADRIESGSLEGLNFPLRDVNGNKVGRALHSRAAPEGEVAEGGVRLNIELGNAAFESDGASEVARLLRVAAEKVRGGADAFPLLDLNGNRVGGYTFQPPASLVKDGKLDLEAELHSGNVYRADDGHAGIADGEFRYVVPTNDFEPGYGQDEGDAYLVNARGEVAPGYEKPQIVRERDFSELRSEQVEELLAVAEGRVSFEDFERRQDGEGPAP